MMPLLRRLYWWIAAPVYFLFELRLLLVVSPVFEDADGPMPSLFWGKAVYPTAQQYAEHHLKYNAEFLLPYCLVALLVTLIGCGLALSASHSKQAKALHHFLAVLVTTLTLLLTFACISDVGTYSHLWNGPRFFSADMHALVALSFITFIPALLSGFLVVGRSSLDVF